MARRKLTLFVDGRGRSVLHRHGFSWLAFVAVPLWALRRRLWTLVPLSLLVLTGLHALAEWLLGWLPSQDAQGLLALGWLLAESWFMGRQANRWHAGWLMRRGFVPTATELPDSELPPSWAAPPGGRA